MTNPFSTEARIAELERDVLALQHVDRAQGDQLAAVQAAAERVLASIGELLQESHGFDARLTVLEQRAEETLRALAGHGALLREILDRLPPREV